MTGVKLRRRTKFAIGVFALVSLSPLLVGTILTSRLPIQSNPLPAGAELVHIKTRDGIDIVGNFWRGQDDHAPAILMLHGQFSSREQFDDEGQQLAAKGYAALAINFRAVGESSGNQVSLGYFESLDSHAAFTWLKSRQHGAKVGVAGESMGGAAALIGPDGPLPADAMALTVVYPDIRQAIRRRARQQFGVFLGDVIEPLLSYQSRFRFGVWPEAMSTVSAVRKFHKPVFIIGGEKDEDTPPDDTKMLFDAANEPKQFWMVRGGTHESTTEDPEYSERVEAFFDRTLRWPVRPNPTAPPHRS